MYDLDSFDITPLNTHSKRNRPTERGFWPHPEEEQSLGHIGGYSKDCFYVKGGNPPKEDNFISYFINKGNPVHFVAPRKSLYDLDDFEIPHYDFMLADYNNIFSMKPDNAY